MTIKSADQITIVDVTDAYSVILSSEAYTFVGGTTGATSGSCTTEVSALCGSNLCSSVIVSNGDITCPAGISASIKGSGTEKVTITFTLTATLSAACEATIKVHVDGIEISKKFSFAVAKTGTPGVKGDPGATGKGVSSVTITYKPSSSNTTPPTGTWESAPPPVSAGSYLWTKFVFNYTDGTTSDPSYSVAKQGDTGATGASGGRWYSGTGITGTSTTATVFSGSGVSSAVVGDMYLNISTYNTYRCTTGGAASVAKWVYVNNIKGTPGVKGDPGAAGADAITLVITSSNGTVFKNNTGSTVLTAHVYKGGVEQSITDAGVCGSLGSVKWYNGSGTQPAGWPKTSKTITAGASSGSGIDIVVSNTAAITCQLEK